MLLLLKVVLVPALVVIVTLGGRRWGPRVGGFLTSFPIVAGPTLFFFATEQGTAFARDAARATLVALVGVAASGLVYAWASLRLRWWASLVASWASFVLMTLGLNALGWSLPVALIVAIASFFVVRVLLPSPRGERIVGERSAWDLPLRIATSVTVVRPDGGRRALASGSIATFNDTDQVGVYTVEQTVAGTTDRSWFAVNLFSDAASQLTPVDHLTLPPQEPTAPVAASHHGFLQIWPWIALLGLVLVVAEWLAFHRGL